MDIVLLFCILSAMWSRKGGRQSTPIEVLEYSAEVLRQAQDPQTFAPTARKIKPLRFGKTWESDMEVV